MISSVDSGEGVSCLQTLPKQVASI